MALKKIKLLLSAALIVVFLAGAQVFATTAGTGAGPEDVYGGSVENRNYCTPYHLLQSGEVEDITYEFKRPADIRVLDPDHFQYWTKGNNISRSLTLEGMHVQTRDWQQNAIGAEYPRGSSFGIFRSAALELTCHGEFNARVPKDTTISHYLGTPMMGGKIPEDLSYRQDLDYVDKCGNTWGLHVSTRPEDVADWPVEFCDENGEPIIKSDEDVVVIYAAIGNNLWSVNGAWWGDGFKGGYSSYNVPAAPYIECQERVMSFGGGLTRDILFHEYKLVNKSLYHSHPGIGPYDIEGLFIGPWAFAQMGDDSNPQRWAWVDSLRLFFTFEESFTDAAMPGTWTPLIGFTVLKSMPMTDPETGDSIEAPLATASGCYGRNGEGTWGLWTGNYGAAGGYRYKVNTGLPQYQYIQDPQRLPEHKGTMIPDIADASDTQIAMLFGDHKFTLCPGEATYFTYALVCAFPQGSDPPSLATTPDGLMIVAAQLFKNAMLAHTLYPDFKMAKAPFPPNVKLIPGDHQVTITWDNVSMYSRDDFYDVLAGQ
ncbi:MAG: hypothetical protein JXQ83_09810, partial [Candidatus Glassbacteria bacterium]|nr:hypothetical protein [Candidatus Glassbacteria bacterium]